MITKKGTEKGIADMDAIVKDVCEKVGMYSWEGRDLMSDWGRVRDRVARCAANSLAGNYDKNAGKKVIKPNIYAVASEITIDDTTKKKSIEMAKSKAAVSEPVPVIKQDAPEKFIIKI